MRNKNISIALISFVILLYLVGCIYLLVKIDYNHKIRDIIAPNAKEKQTEIVSPEKLTSEEPINIIKEVHIDPNDVTKISGASPEMIDSILKDTWLEGYGELYYELENKYHINAYFAIANSFQEVGWDKSKSNYAMERNNIYGLLDKEFESIDDCIQYYFELIDKYYVDYGYKSIVEINVKYCPNDNTWSSDIIQIATKLKNKTDITVD